MSAIGPELPPHLLAKRKRKREGENSNAKIIASGATRSPNPESSEKRRNMVGPTMPPAALDDIPPSDKAHHKQQEDPDESSEDEIGPALPTASSQAVAHHSSLQDVPSSSLQDHSTTSGSGGKLKRDDWMTMAPSQDDLSRMDPSKPRARGFNTNMGARGPPAAAGGGSAWHETPEEKRRRLENEMMGVASSDRTGSTGIGVDVKRNREQEKAQKIRAEVERARGASLMDQHITGKGRDVEDDDPSKRVFDREKDIGSGGGISASQRKKILSQASNFTSKFQSGS
ncbi:hypothetical protein K431DRAFT_347587 [Polychaeton citri CBS 116435]|uniref:DUF3752 domain-containing protein n=1 Tax=Polychaeton citri CBS 116435 TaxID=1314669 RepID=A0A9P4Q627_9PEZI|nr:hypothetical protein K431DRAFT_347587 [Polychaeton citri CBS 116435]